MAVGLIYEHLVLNSEACYSKMTNSNYSDIHSLYHSNYLNTKFHIHSRHIVDVIML